MQTKRVVIMDADGTVFGGVRRAIAVFCRLLRERGVTISLPLYRELSLEWGTKLGRSRTRFFPQISEMELSKIFPLMRPHTKIAPYPGMIETCALMRSCGIELNMATSRASVEIRRNLGESGLRQYLTRLICLEDVGWAHAKPEPLALELILRELKRCGISSDEVVFVGDALEADWPCAQAAGIEFVAVREEKVIPRRTWIEHGVPAENILDSFRDLPAWLGLVSGSRLHL